MAEDSDSSADKRMASLSAESTFSASDLVDPEQEKQPNDPVSNNEGHALMDTISSRISSTRRAIGHMITSAVEQIHSIDQQPADQMHFGEMQSNVGQIRLQPDPATALSTGAMGKVPTTLNNLELGTNAQDQHRRPGLMSQYLRLMVLDRKQNRKSQRDQQSALSNETTLPSEQQDDGRLWLDISKPSSPRRSTANPRRRRSKLRMGLKSLHSSQRSSVAVTPVANSLANTPGMPFRHLSEALPWAASQRHLASACATPTAHTRRQSISSITGDVSTIPRMTTDSSTVEESIARLHQFDTSKRAAKSGQNIEQQNILHAIEVLLKHQRFLVLIAKALMMYGSPLHHLENNLIRTAQLLDLEITASALPGLILLSFEDSLTHTSETKIIRCTNGWDMHRLDQTNQLLRRVVRSSTDVDQAIVELEQIITAPPIYAWYWQVLNWGIISWSLCLVCFGGSWRDSGLALVLGLMGGVLSLAAGKFSGYTNLFEVSVSILTGLLGAALSRWGCFAAISLSATAVLLPGLVMTTGVIELSSRHMVAGTVRVFYALLLAFIIAYGLLIGVEIYNKIAGNPLLDGTLLDLTQCQSLTRWSWFGTFPIGIINIAVLVNIHWRHWISVTVVAGICYGVFWLFKFHLELDDLAPVVASFVLGMVANIWSKFTGQTAYMILLPGEMFLVPGSVGVRGFSSLLSKEGGQGLSLALQMITTCLSIMIGLFASSFMVYPRGKQHSALVTV
ncbi:pheromone-regulated protein prm10 [Coemansia sp. RSA 1822]|nr:pheromone-regulated protein prm10 [Coemansia sp. RSA 638]KAJ2543764.1 pheromone-regulated protein prm10 [Coemansia sp. RSA 1853]KAJ2561832.1 pheromone-regulated protein prm10 [Coemansia sp. RSA 1822]